MLDGKSAGRANIIGFVALPTGAAARVGAGSTTRERKGLFFTVVFLIPNVFLGVGLEFVGLTITHVGLPFQIFYLLEPSRFQSSLFFFSLILLIADGPHHYHPACGHKGSSHLSPVQALRFFYRDASSAFLQILNQWLNFTHSRSHAFRYEKKEHKSNCAKNQTHDFRTSRCAGYLLDHSGDVCCYPTHTKLKREVE